MFTISPDGIITLSRGDTFEAPLFINSGTRLHPQRYVLKDLDELYFGVMEPNQLFENAIVRKKYTNNDVNDNGDIVIKFSSDDTINLLPGKYYYQAKLKSNNGADITTIAQKQLFFIIE